MKFECDILLKWNRIVMMREPISDYYCWRTDYHYYSIGGIGGFRFLDRCLHIACLW